MLHPVHPHLPPDVREIDSWPLVALAVIGPLALLVVLAVVAVLAGVGV